jgi:hypothetical protein
MDDRSAERDETLSRVRGALTPLPQVAPSSIARVLAATAQRTPPSAWARFAEWMATPSLSLARAGAFAVLALVVGFAARGAWSARTVDARVATTSGIPADADARTAPGTTANATIDPTTNATALPAASTPARVAVQLVFDAPQANSVAVVGDFNDWQPAAAPMRRLEAGQPWTAVVMVPPGRHTYAFLVDGTRWTADPRAPRARDDDFGKPGSVLVVQAP